MQNRNIVIYFFSSKSEEKSENRRRKAAIEAEGCYPIGSKLRVKYGKGNHQKFYDAKV